MHLCVPYLRTILSLPMTSPSPSCLSLIAEPWTHARLFRGQCCREFSPEKTVIQNILGGSQGPKSLQGFRGVQNQDKGHVYE